MRGMRAFSASACGEVRESSVASSVPYAERGKLRIAPLVARARRVRCKKYGARGRPEMIG